MGAPVVAWEGPMGEETESIPDPDDRVELHDVIDQLKRTLGFVSTPACRRDEP
jgi:hypothetical protein